MVGLLWFLKVLHESVPDKFTREWAFLRNENGSFDAEDDDDDDDLSFVDPWNAPFTYVSTQQRRMVQSSISTMVDIQKNIGELPKRFKRKHWPWETIRRKVLGEESDNEEREEDDFSTTSKTNDSIVSSIGAGEERKENDYSAASTSPRGDRSGEVHSGENEINGGSDHNGCAKKDEKQLCIGSIFGLDVGGTLAKLVYFEKKAPDNDPLHTRSLREKHYVQAVSAQTVIMARMQPEQAHGQFAAKRSTSMSPMRRFSGSGIGGENRARSSTGDETDVIGHSTISSINRVSGRMPVRRRAATDDVHPIQIDGIQNVISKDDYHIIYKEEEEKTSNTLAQHDYRNKKSTDDLKNLYAIRQESLPDDIRQFQNSVGFLNIPPHVEENPDSENKDDFSNIVDDDDENDSLSNPPETSLPTPTPSAAAETSSFRKMRSLSMLDLSAQHDRQKAEALNRFYDFARRLDANEDSISDIELSFYCRELGGEFHFISFETRKMKNAMDLIRFNNLHMNIRNMGATGGGAHKFADIWEQELGIGMIKQDELNSLVAGMQFVLSTVVGECFTFRPKEECNLKETNIPETKDMDSNVNTSGGEGETQSDQSECDSKPQTKIYKLDRWTRKVQRDTISYSSAYPYMLVTIGTGVSVLRVDGPRKHERVSGSTIGGGTFWGLMRLLTDVENFEEAMKLAEKGDPTKVDMMVGDIYGKDSNALDKLGLSADIVASSFGKLVSKEDPARDLTQEDLARALLSLVTNNIGQVAYLNAKLHKTPRIYFVGSFLRHNMISQRRLSYAIDYWSKGEMEALFLEHEGYFGALGAFLTTQNIEKKDGGFFHWKNNP
eukprot:CAMPEP_0116126860 /NCGR_PEP_ID=MMETSP0329-20121206/6546_1 /TAXON_ID=697910 /ORGANISM="Pseudo-nitzschia arenysensis, Strain B593" /LENGTH=834 /DNA_ID=CAMNT_0003620949 /DNA_START=412 /DNA_END=2913 /DNA_ORIENTATION=-